MNTNGVPEALHDRLGREATLGLLELIETKHMQWSDRVLSLTIERFERRLSEELGRFRVDVMKEIHHGHIDTVRWMFAFWVGQFFAFGGLLAFMLRYTGR